MVTVHILISGKVQGVNFRASTKERADALRILGWVKNRPDGRVEMVAKGDRESINEFISWCKQGPRGAVVSDVDVTEEANEIKFERFLIAR
jgi:acylphosphatase